MSLYPHQVTGVEWLASKTRAGLLDEQGLGKTITAIVAAQKAGVKSMLVVAPTVVAWNWQHEIRKWTGVDAQVVADASTEVTAPVVVTTHGLLVWTPGTMKRPPVFDALRAKEWDLVVLDEAHFFRNPDAQRTRAFYGADGLIHRARRVWVMTGTPMANNATELWTHLRALWPDRCPYSYEEFLHRFCETEWDIHRNDWRVVGNKQERLPELRALMKGLFLRRLKKDHLNLPPIRWETMVLPAAGLSQELQEEMKWALHDRFEDEPPEVQRDPDELLQFLRGSVEFARYRRFCGLAKVAPTLELLRQEMEGTSHKVVVFAHHLDVLAGLEHGLGADNVVTLTGEVSAHERKKRVDLFQTDPTCRVALCQINAAGTGITMTAASDVVFVEQSWVPGDNAQAADRCHRIGQTEPVRVRFLSLAGTVDELVAETLSRKSRAIREVLGEENAKSS